MNLRFERFGVRFHIGLTRTTTVTGVNSTLAGGGQFLMWDFDDVLRNDVELALLEVQGRFQLPAIRVLSTGIDGYYHAYCFKRCSPEEARAIIATTKHVDKVYLTLGIMRGYFTLRFSPKRKRNIVPAFTLESPLPEDVGPEKVESFVQYTTKRR